MRSEQDCPCQALAPPSRQARWWVRSLHTLAAALPLYATAAVLVGLPYVLLIALGEQRAAHLVVNWSFRIGYVAAFLTLTGVLVRQLLTAVDETAQVLRGLCNQHPRGVR